MKINNIKVLKGQEAINFGLFKVLLEPEYRISGHKVDGIKPAPRITITNLYERNPEK